MNLWQKVKLILKSVRENKKYALITPLFMIGEAFIECLMPFTMSILVDSVSQNTGKIIDAGAKAIYQPILSYTNLELGLKIPNVSFLAVVGILVGMAFLSLACGIFGGIFAAKASVGLATNLRSDLYKKIQSFSFENIDKFSTSSLITRMTTDVGQIQMSFQMCIRIVVRAPLMMIFSAILAFITGGPLAFIFVALVPVVGIGLLLIGKSAMKIFVKVFKRYDKLNESVQENVSGMRVVKSFVREEYEKEKFGNASRSVRDDFVRAEKIIALNNPLLNTIIHLSNILVIGIGATLIYKPTSSFTVGQMSAMLTYGIQILTNVIMISMILVMLFMSLESVRRIGEVLEEVPSIQNPENPVMEIENGDIVFKKVNFKYKKTADEYALNNINLNIKSGQFIGILGSTGSGKTSLVNLISRLYDTTEGEVLVGGKNVKDYDLDVLRNGVAVVLQKNVLFSGTITSNLKWGDENASEKEMMKALEIAQAKEIVKGKPEGLMSKVEQGGANFSGGQKQRLCIARAILRKPKIMILDDSTSAVDTKTDRLIRKGLKEDLPAMTKIVIAQRISSIEDADQIIIMDNGKISAVGTHKELMKTSKIYQEVFNTQTKGGK